MNRDFQVGDVVRLKSGGGKMTVHNPFVADDGEVRLCHFGHNGISYALLPPEMLELAEEASDAIILLTRARDNGVDDDWLAAVNEFLEEVE